MLQILEETVEVVLTLTERVQQQTVEHVPAPMPQVPRERVQQQTVEHVPVHQLLEKPSR